MQFRCAQARTVIPTRDKHAHTKISTACKISSYKHVLIHLSFGQVSFSFGQIQGYVFKILLYSLLASPRAEEQ